ncbi:MAG: peptide chain release factor 3 [Bdellovibrionales bacterium]|nr:peptide chain release factor 3 [Bdellovibrionales bacterium]
MTLSVDQEIDRRRTFAIISHPDAGKTTITERILFAGGVIRETGDVKAKAGKKTATSDWMALEKERGVSITSSVMQFDHRGLRINLLDTPGHKDFGEDTYRTLVAADSAAMLIDAAKGVEIQTRKLYEVCSLRKMPIFTFANKMDRDGKEPMELIDDVESTLGIRCFPVTWPIGMGESFRGLYHRLHKKLYLYTKGEIEPEVVAVDGWQDKKIKDLVGDELFNKLQEDLELLEGALGPFLIEEFLAGEVSPMTFGSAKFSWGVDLFLDLFADYAPGPVARRSQDGLIDPHDKGFSGFIFKIQANMDRKHRDRVAFMRICSGKFERGMKVKHTRLGREIRLAYANQFMAQDRETIEEAYSGDIVGVNDSGNFQIGDSVSVGKSIEFTPMPRFSPEVFAKLTIKDPLKRKQLQKALMQLSEEGMVQLFYDPFFGLQDPILGVVGELQFDVLMFRLNDEYNLEVKLERQPFSVARWPRKKDGAIIGKSINGGAKLYMDNHERPVVLLAKEWDLNWLIKENPDLEFHITGG